MTGKMELQIIGAQSYSFKDDLGKLLEGVNIFHLADADVSNGGVGKIPSKINLPLSVWSKLSNITYPVKCELVTAQQITRKGIVTKVVDVIPQVLSK